MFRVLARAITRDGRAGQSRYRLLDEGVARFGECPTVPNYGALARHNQVKTARHNNKFSRRGRQVGPTCEVLLDADDNAALDVIDVVLSATAQRIERRLAFTITCSRPLTGGWQVQWERKFGYLNE